MNPLSWIIVATLTFSSPLADRTEHDPGHDFAGKKPTKNELLSPTEKAQWDKWEKEWDREVQQNEDEILIEFLPMSTSQMPNKKMEN